jgi:hypothetical protein
MKYSDIPLKYNSKRITLYYNIYIIVILHIPNTEMRTEAKKYFMRYHTLTTVIK